MEGVSLSCRLRRRLGALFLVASFSLEACLAVGGGSALVIGGDSNCPASFPWETSFSFGAFGGSEMALVAASFP